MLRMQYFYTHKYIYAFVQRRESLAVSVHVSTSHAVGRGFAARSGHTKDYHKNGTNCIFAWHAVVKIGERQCNPAM